MFWNDLVTGGDRTESQCRVAWAAVILLSSHVICCDGEIGIQQTFSKREAVS